MSPDEGKNFRVRVEEVMSRVPKGSVTTYGDIAALAGSPFAAQIVGSIAHYGNIELPWHRLVNKSGGLASGYHGGRAAQQQHLAAEGVTCTDFYVDNFQELRWRP